MILPKIPILIIDLCNSSESTVVLSQRYGLSQRAIIDLRRLRHIAWCQTAIVEIAAYTCHHPEEDPEVVAAKFSIPSVTVRRIVKLRWAKTSLYVPQGEEDKFLANKKHIEEGVRYFLRHGRWPTPEWEEQKKRCLAGFRQRTPSED